MRNLLGDFEVYVEGFGFAGLISGVTPPELTWMGDDYVGGGLMGKRKIGLILDAMTSTLKSQAMLPDLMATWGLKPGSVVSYKIMGSLIVPGSSEVPLKIKMSGYPFKMKRDEFVPGKVAGSEYTVEDITYYEETVDGTQVWEIDIVNMILKNRGVDQMVDRRRNLGRV